MYTLQAQLSYTVPCSSLDAQVVLYRKVLERTGRISSFERFSKTQFHVHSFLHTESMKLCTKGELADMHLVYGRAEEMDEPLLAVIENVSHPKSTPPHFVCLSASKFV